MMTLLPKTHIDFLKYRNIFFALFALVILVGIGSFFTKGLNLGIDFTGGTLVQVKFEQPVEMSKVRDALGSTGRESELQSYGAETFAIREKSTDAQVGEVQKGIESALVSVGVPFTVLQTNSVGPVVGENMTERAMWAILLSLVFIIIYVAFRFSNIVWGVSGVIALFHDLFIMAVFFSLTQREIDLVVVAAFLTVAGFSINDTIVIFDRIRENIRLNPKMSFKEIINLSINETLSRTIITSMTVIVALAILYVFGGEALNTFSFAMLVGCVAGVYSTIALSTPIVYVWQKGQLSDHDRGERAPAKVNASVSRPVVAHAAPAAETSHAPASTGATVRKSRRSKK